jgi:hypothetical protein
MRPQPAPLPRCAPASAIALVLALGLGLWGNGASAEGGGEAVFDIRLGGVRAATLTLAGADEGAAYRLAARIETSGAARLVARFAYRGEAEGRRTRDGFAPRRYEETADTGRRQSAAVVAWDDGLPRLETDNRTRLGAAEPVTPAEARGSIDPLTALWSALRDRPAGAACGFDLRLFDGARLSRLAIGPPEPLPPTPDGSPRNAGTGPSAPPSGFACKGEYRRLAGFPEEEMRRRTRFAMRLEFQPIPGDDRVRVSRVSLETLRGPAELVRR